MAPSRQELNERNRYVDPLGSRTIQAAELELFAVADCDPLALRVVKKT